MKLNDIELVGYSTSGHIVTFTLGCDFSQALALDGEELTVKDGGTDMAVFGGYKLLSLENSGEYTVARFGLKLEPNTEATISALQKNLGIAESSIKSTATKADSAQSQIADLTDHLNAYGEAIEELATQVLA